MRQTRPRQSLPEAREQTVLMSALTWHLPLINASRPSAGLRQCPKRPDGLVRLLFLLHDVRRYRPDRWSEMRTAASSLQKRRLTSGGHLTVCFSFAAPLASSHPDSHRAVDPKARLGRVQTDRMKLQLASPCSPCRLAATAVLEMLMNACGMRFLAEACLVTAVAVRENAGHDPSVWFGVQCLCLRLMRDKGYISHPPRQDRHVQSA